MSEQREMTLEEWVSRLPTCHLAYRQYQDLLADRARLRALEAAEAAKKEPHNQE